MKKISKLKILISVLTTCAIAVSLVFLYNSNRPFLREAESKLTGRPLVAADDANQLTPFDFDAPKEMRWKSKDIAVYIDANQPQEYISAYKSALNLWNSYNIIHFHEVGNVGQARVILTHETLPDDNDNYILLAVTYPRVYTRLKYLSEAEVKFNDTALMKHKQVIRPHSKLTSIAVHELGHAIGLSHDNKKNTVMSATSDVNHDTYIDDFTLSRVRKLYE